MLNVINGDALEVLWDLDESSVDLVYADPPYNLQLPNKTLRRWNRTDVVERVDDEWDRFDSLEQYDGFVANLLMGISHVLKPTGTLWIQGSYHNIHRVGSIMQDLGYWLLGDVHWLKTNPMPNWWGKRFTNATETLIWASTNKDAKHFFDKDLAKRYGVGKVGANVWRIPITGRGERLYGENGEKVHSTQKPKELLRRIISISSQEGDVVLDPVAGTGTTGVVAHNLGREYILIEKEPEYIPWIFHRLETEGE